MLESSLHREPIMKQVVMLIAMLLMAGSALAPAAHGQVRRVVPRVGPGAAAVAAHATPEEVELAIQKAQQYLFNHQQRDGSFERNGAAAGMGQVGGASALATYALLT